MPDRHEDQEVHDCDGYASAPGKATGKPWHNARHHAEHNT
jgi:hypothetical protein